MQYARGNEIIQTYVGHEQNMKLKIKSVKSTIQEFLSHAKNNILLSLVLSVLCCTVNCKLYFVVYSKIYPNFNPRAFAVNAYAPISEYPLFLARPCLNTCIPHP